MSRVSALVQPSEPTLLSLSATFYRAPLERSLVLSVSVIQVHDETVASELGFFPTEFTSRGRSVRRHPSRLRAL